MVPGSIRWSGLRGYPQLILMAAGQFDVVTCGHRKSFRS